MCGLTSTYGKSKTKTSNLFWNWARQSSNPLLLDVARDGLTVEPMHLARIWFLQLKDGQIANKNAYAHTVTLKEYDVCSFDVCAKTKQI